MALKITTAGKILPEEFEEEMCRIWEEEGGDAERAHELMDTLMTTTLARLGYGAGLVHFDSQKKHYG